ncbi:DUF58 domain-containing protein [Chloroflexota bacterium]
MGSYWLVIPLVLFIGSLILHQVPLLLVALLLFLTGAVAKLWGRYCLSRVEYNRRLSASRVFWGEEVQLEVEVANRKLLPLFWLQIDDEIPDKVTLPKGKTSPTGNPNRSMLTSFLSLGWYHKVTRRYPMKCLQRGHFTFGPAQVSSGDLFGFNKRRMGVPGVNHLIVYPRILPLEKLGIPAKQPFGDIRLEKHLYQDPVLTSGVRDYHYGDSLKQIHWKTTARRGRLQTKIFEPTTTIDIGIFLDVRTVKPPLWGSVPQLLELGIITAASVSNYALTKGYRVGLHVNQNRWTDKASAIKLLPSRHASQQMRIMETLAQLHEVENIPIAQLVLKESRNLPEGSTILVVSAVTSDTLMSSLIRIKRSGRRVVLIQIGSSRPAVSHDGLIVYRVPDEVMWNELQTLAIDTTANKSNLPATMP